jgi:CheY-like chemotaxis protein
MQPAPRPSTIPRFDGLCVLVVDDMPEIRTMLVALLRIVGARGIAVNSAAAALEALERERLDALLADISMPGEDGFSLIRKIRALPPRRGGDIPAAAFTGWDTDAVVDPLSQAGFDLYLPKPVSLESLIRSIAILELLRPTRQPASIAS